MNQEVNSVSNYSYLLKAQDELMKAIESSVDRLVQNGNVTKSRINVRVESLMASWKKFQDNHIQLEQIRCQDTSTTNIEEEIYYLRNYYSKCEESYLEALARLMDLQQEHAPLIISHSTQEVDKSTLNHTDGRGYSLHLPPVDLPKFSGDFRDWTTFRDLFTSLIIDNPDLTPIEKLQYLKLSLMCSIPINDDNFQTAWDGLTQYYNNTRILVDVQIDILLHLPTLTDATAEGMQHLRNTIVQALNTLKGLNRPVEHWGDLIVAIVVRKFDISTLREWERFLGASVEPPTADKLEEFMIARIHTLYALETSSESNSSIAKSTIASATSLYYKTVSVAKKALENSYQWFSSWKNGKREHRNHTNFSI